MLFGRDKAAAAEKALAESKCFQAVAGGKYVHIGGAHAGRQLTKSQALFKVKGLLWKEAKAKGQTKFYEDKYAAAKAAYKTEYDAWKANNPEAAEAEKAKVAAKRKAKVGARIGRRPRRATVSW